MKNYLQSVPCTTIWTLYIEIVLNRYLGTFSVPYLDAILISVCTVISFISSLYLANYLTFVRSEDQHFVYSLVFSLVCPHGLVDISDRHYYAIYGTFLEFDYKNEYHTCNMTYCLQYALLLSFVDILTVCRVSWCFCFVYNIYAKFYLCIQ